MLATVALNQGLFATGDTVRVSLAASNPGIPETADVYTGLLLPDGDPGDILTAAMAGFTVPP